MVGEIMSTIEQQYETYSKNIPHNFLRALNDVWYFGAYVEGIGVIPFESFDIKEYEGIKWIDFEAYEGDVSDFNFKLGELKCAHIDRRTITVRLDKVIAIYELTNT